MISDSLLEICLRNELSVFYEIPEFNLLYLRIQLASEVSNSYIFDLVRGLSVRISDLSDYVLLELSKLEFWSEIELNYWRQVKEFRDIC